MSAWLYPLAKRAGFHFEIKGGTKKKKIPVSLDNYRELVQTGKLKEDAWWWVYFNYERIEPGDGIYIYTGDRDTGIIGYATVQGKRDKRRWKEIGVKVDLAKCRMLIEQPISAQIVRSWIRFPRHTVENLELFETELQRCLPWKVDSPTAYTGFQALNLKSRSNLVISPREHERQFIHDTLLGPAARLLEDKRFRPATRSFGKLQVDLVGIRKRHIIIAEGKTNKRGFGREEARQAFGQLYEYRWYFKRSSEGKWKYSLWVIFQEMPNLKVIEFLEDHGFLVSWVQNRLIRFAIRSKKQFQRLAK